MYRLPGLLLFLLCAAVRAQKTVPGAAIEQAGERSLLKVAEANHGQFVEFPR